MAEAHDASKLSDADLLYPSAIPVVEDYIRHQSATQGVHNAKLGRSLLQLYQMNVAKANLDLVLQVLAKALLTAPDNDFQLAAYLIPASMRDHESVKALAALEAALQTGKYEDFWALCKNASVQAILSSIASFEESARETVLRSLNKVYNRIDVALLGTFLNSADVAGVCAKAGWAIEGSQAVPPSMPENTARPKKPVDDGLKYTDVAGLVQSLSR